MTNKKLQPMPNSVKELRLYIEHAFIRARDLKALAERKKRTVKMRCADVTLAMVMARLNGVRCLAREGPDGPVVRTGYEIASVFFQKEIYDPVLDYWEKQLSTKEE